MTIILKSPISIAGVPQLIGTILTLGIAKESDYVNRGVAEWVEKNPTVTQTEEIKNLSKDNRILAKWFSGGISGKSVVFSGDSTTQAFQNAFPTASYIYRDGRVGRVQTKYPNFANVKVYSRGENSGTLSQFLNNSFTDNHRNDPTANFYLQDTYGNIDAIIALDADLYVLSWGINDTTSNTSYTAQLLSKNLTIAVDKIRAAVPKACIILRMPNSLSVDNPYMSGGATAQNCMDRYQTGYMKLRNVWPDVLVWNSHMGLFPMVAPATAAGCPLLNTDGLHPSVSAYDQILNTIFEIADPVLNSDLNGSMEASLSGPFIYNKTDNLLRWDQRIDTNALSGSDWYKVYGVRLQYAGRGLYFTMSMLDYAKNGSTTIAQSAWAAGIIAPGLVPGDIISLANKSGQAFTFVVKVNPNTQSGNELSYNPNPHPAGTWSAAETEDLIAGHPVPAESYLWIGYIYRHKYANSVGMRGLKTAFAKSTSYDTAAGTVDPYAVSRRFYISATPALGAFTAQTIQSETGGDLSLRAWATTDTVCIPGVTSGVKTGTAAEGLGALGITLTGGIFTADTVNKRMAVTGVTSAGVLVDFSKYMIPHGYVLSAT